VNITYVWWLRASRSPLPWPSLAPSFLAPRSLVLDSNSRRVTRATLAVEVMGRGDESERGLDVEQSSERGLDMEQSNESGTEVQPMEIRSSWSVVARRRGLGLLSEELPYDPYSMISKDALRCADQITWLDRILTLEVACVWFMSFLIMYPHEAPFHGDPLFHRGFVKTTLWMWDHAGETWSYYMMGALLTFVTAALISQKYARVPGGPRSCGTQLHSSVEGALWWLLRPRIRWRVWFLAVGTVVFIGATVHSQIILPNIDHTLPEWPTNLWICHRWCDNVWDYCSIPQPPQGQQMLLSGGVNSTAAVAWYHRNVFGSVHGHVVATMLDDSTVRLVIGPAPSGLTLEEDIVLSRPGHDNATFLLGEGSLFELGEKMGGEGSDAIFISLPAAFAWPSRHGDDACPNGGPHFERRREGACALGGGFAVQAAALNAIKDALHAHFTGITVNVFGASRGGKAATWSISSRGLHPGSKPFDNAYIHMGGTFGPGSVKLVGACAEGWAAMVTRWPQWFDAGAPALSKESNSWPYDVADYLIAGCHTTQYTFSVDWNIQWKNWVGCMHSIRRMRDAGCKVRVVEGEAPALSLRVLFDAVDGSFEGRSLPPSP